MTESRPRTEHRGPGAMVAVANSLIALHKEQFGRGPRKARADFAGPDALVCVLDDALLPAERATVDMAEQQRVRESPMFLQVATSTEFIRGIAEIVHPQGLLVRQRHGPGPGGRDGDLRVRAAVSRRRPSEVSRATARGPHRTTPLPA